MQSAHVVQPVGELDEHDAYVVNHREHHLSYILCLLFLTRDIADLRNLCEPINKMCNLFPKILTYGVEVDECVLNYIVQQAGGHRNFIKPHVGQDISDFERVYQIRLAGSTFLSFVLARRKKVGAAQQIRVRLGMIFVDLLDDVFDTNHWRQPQDTCALSMCAQFAEFDYNK